MQAILKMETEPSKLFFNATRNRRQLPEEFQTDGNAANMSAVSSTAMETELTPKLLTQLHVDHE